MNTIEQWNNAAEMFARNQEMSEYAAVNKRVVMDRFTDLRGKALLDLGCGYGWYTDYFSKIGAAVVGCDGSDKMIGIARNRYPEVEFEQVDLLGELPYADNRFDIVFCNQVLMDVEDITGVLREVNRITADGGIFYMSITHPAFYGAHWSCDESGFKNARVMERYLSEYSFDNEFWGKTKHYHRTMSTYINTVIDSGFVLSHLEEPESYDGINKSNEFPLFLFAEFRKATR